MRNQPIHSTERGFALPVAIFTMVIAGVLATAGFFMARQESRIGMASENASFAFYLTERGAVDLMENFTSSGATELSLWDNVTVSQVYAGMGTVESTITKMSSRMYFADMRGTVTRGGAMLSGASRRIGMILRLTSAEIEPPAALTTRGATTIGGTAFVNGTDSDPPNWDGSGNCSGVYDDKAGIMSDDTTLVTISGRGNVTGSPSIDQDTTINSSTFLQFGDLSWADLTSYADVVIAGAGGSMNVRSPAPDSTSAGTCNEGGGFPRNWGNPEDPDAACGMYFPIVYLSGATTSFTIQSNGRGQGMLLVDGDLDLRGGFLYYGVIIVQGAFETHGSGNRVMGGVMAGNANFSSQSIIGGSVVNNSTCAVSTAILNANGLTRARPLAERSFVDISAISY